MINVIRILLSVILFGLAGVPLVIAPSLTIWNVVSTVCLASPGTFFAWRGFICLKNADAPNMKMMLATGGAIGTLVGASLHVTSVLLSRSDAVDEWTSAMVNSGAIPEIPPAAWGSMIIGPAGWGLMVVGIVYALPSLRLPSINGEAQ